MDKLNRTLGIPLLTFYGVGMILGAGIYSIIGKAAAETGATLWLGFLIAAVAALLTAFSYAELAAMFPKAGAEYVYLSHAYKRKYLAESIGMAMAFAGAATASAVAVAFAGYLNQFVEIHRDLIACTLLILFTTVAIMGIKESAWTNTIFTLIEILGLCLIIYFGVKSETFGKTLQTTPHSGTLSGAALIIFSFFGFENIVNLSEEAEKPERQIPFAIFLSLGISTVLYVAVSLSVLAILPIDQLAASDAAMMSVAERISPELAKILGGIALFSTANTALISMIGASRILYGMAEENSLPKVFESVLKKRRTPWVASIAVLVTSLLLLLLGQLEVIASTSSLATMISFLAVNVTLIHLRFTQPNLKRPFKVPFHIGKIPIFPILGGLFSLLFLFQFEKTVYWTGGSFLMIISIVFFIRDRKIRNA